MFIILLAHVPGNSWALWIPARFGFSDATEIFVFCSGMASAMAFGAVFAERGWTLGAARVAFRVWQVYWAHIGVFVLTAAMLVAIDLNGWGIEGRRYVAEPYIVPFFEQTGPTLAALMTLTYVPGLFDILPMYLVILAMIPLVTALHARLGPAAVAAFMALCWIGATVAGLGFSQGGAPAQGLSGALAWMNLPADPRGVRTWFFNPFAWQLVFFTGFAFGMGWLPAPPRSRKLVWLALAVLVVSIPFAWFKIHEGFWIGEGSAAHLAIAGMRDALAPLWTKTWFGLLRYVHFLALAYVAWMAVGPRGRLLDAGFAAPEPAPGARLRRVALAAPVVLLSAPYAYIETIRAVWPALDAFVLAHFPMFGGRTGLVQLAHLAALVVLGWNAAPQRARVWLCESAPVRATPVIRKVGTQSLAVFMTSIPLSQLMGLALDHLGRNAWSWGLVNVAGFALLIATAYGAAWFKSHPWRAPRPERGPPAPDRAASRYARAAQPAE